MIQNVLGKTAAESEAAEAFDDLRRHRREAEFVNGLLAGAHDVFIHFFADLRNDFFDAGGMDASNEDETMHRFASDLAANRIEAGEDDGIRCVVDEDGNA